MVLNVGPDGNAIITGLPTPAQVDELLARCTRKMREALLKTELWNNLKSGDTLNLNYRINIWNSSQDMEETITKLG